MRTLPILCSLLFAMPGAAQDLRRGLLDADLVAVGRQVGKKKHDEELELHRVQVVHDVRGAAGNTAVTVLDWPKLGLHQRPTPRQSRLYCLQDASAVAARLGLPTADGPYYKMVGWVGCNPLVGSDVQADPTVQFAKVLAGSDAGARPGDTADALCRTALAGAPIVRIEAARLLTERADLRALLSPLQWSQLMSRAGGELDDLPHKIALAELCAEQRLDGLLDTLAVSLGPVTDPEYARAVGRIGRRLHGEDATLVLLQRLQQLREPESRAVVMLAIGATNSQSAFDALQRLQDLSPADAAVAAGLKEHRGTRAAEAAARRK